MTVIGHTFGTPLGDNRRRLIRVNGQITGGLLTRLVGAIFQKIENDYTIDYKKWLGPDWKPSYEPKCTIVSNHINWIDILVMMSVDNPSFIAKVGIKRYPGINKIAIAMQCLFLDRTGTKEERLAMLELIRERQALIVEGKMPPLLIYPEGCTTNGRFLITFKKGAFASLLPV